MASLQVDAQKVAEILQALTGSPTSQNIGDLVEYHTLCGYWTATLQGDADTAKSEREFAEAQSFAKRKSEDPKASAALLEAYALIDTMTYRKAEIKAVMNAKKIANLWESVRECINAVKYVGRGEGQVRVGP